MKTLKSEQFEFVYEDIKKAIKNALIFGSPLLILILLEIQAGGTFKDIRLLAGAWCLQMSIDLIKKFVKVNTYSVKK